MNELPENIAFLKMLQTYCATVRRVNRNAKISIEAGKYEQKFGEEIAKLMPRKDEVSTPA